MLANLVEAFEFSPTDNEVYWNWATVDYPTMEKEETEPSLILQVESL